MHYRIVVRINEVENLEYLDQRKGLFQVLMEHGRYRYVAQVHKL